MVEGEADIVAAEAAPPVGVLVEVGVVAAAGVGVVAAAGEEAVPPTGETLYHNDTKHSDEAITLISKI